MPHVMTLLEVGRMLHVPIPKALVRELGLVKRQLVTVERTKDGTLRVVILEDYLRERRRLQRHSA